LSGDKLFYTLFALTTVYHNNVIAFLATHFNIRTDSGDHPRISATWVWLFGYYGIPYIYNHYITLRRYSLNYIF
jgi:hypothetical protein